MNIDILDSAYTVWEGTTTKDILFKRNTISFDPLIIIGNGDSPRAAPAVAVSGNNVHVVWGVDNSPGRFVLYRRSTDGGANFGSTVNINEASGRRDGAPAVAASGDNVYVVWCDSLEIFYSRSRNGGANFGSTMNISNTIFDSQNPAVAASSNLT